VTSDIYNGPYRVVGKQSSAVNANESKKVLETVLVSGDFDFPLENQNSSKGGEM